MSKKEAPQEQQAEELDAAAAEAGNPEAATASVEELAATIEALEAKAQENWDHFVRTKAEMDNMRRRTERDLENAHKYALERFAQELLPVKDSLELGAAAARDGAADIDRLREGTEMTLRMLDTAMEKFHIKAVDPLDEPFNPELHQAMSMVEVADKPANTVINVLQKGYTLNERLVRPAMVVVSKAASPTETESGTNVDEQA
ncbi:MAG: nucleotide exchange factor GrpE [Gammaproteobacteria bacterium]